MTQPLTSPSASRPRDVIGVAEEQTPAKPLPEVAARLFPAAWHSVVDHACRLYTAEGLCLGPEDLNCPWVSHHAIFSIQPLTQALATPVQAMLLPECESERPSASQVESLLRGADAALAELNQQLSRRPFVGGEDFSFADALWTGYLARLKMLGLSEMCRDGRNPHVDRFYHDMKARPSFAASFICDSPSAGRLLLSVLRANLSNRTKHVDLKILEEGQ